MSPLHRTGCWELSPARLVLSRSTAGCHQRAKLQPATRKLQEQGTIAQGEPVAQQSWRVMGRSRDPKVAQAADY